MSRPEYRGNYDEIILCVCEWERESERVCVCMCVYASPGIFNPATTNITSMVTLPLYCIYPVQPSCIVYIHVDYIILCE